MTDFLLVLDGDTVPRKLKVYADGDIWTPIHRVEGDVNATLTGPLELTFDGKTVSNSVSDTTGPLPVTGPVRITNTDLPVTLTDNTVHVDNPFDGRILVSQGGSSYPVGYNDDERPMPVIVTGSVSQEVYFDTPQQIFGDVGLKLETGDLVSTANPLPVRQQGNVTVDPITVTNFPTGFDSNVTNWPTEFQSNVTNFPTGFDANVTNWPETYDLPEDVFLTHGTTLLSLTAEAPTGLTTPLSFWGFTGGEDIQVYIGSVGHTIYVVLSGATGLDVNVTDTFATLVDRINSIEPGTLTLATSAGDDINFTMALSSTRSEIVSLQGNVDLFGWTSASASPKSIIPTVRVEPTAAAITNRSGSIATGGTAQTLMAANPQRKGYSVQNRSTASLFISEVETAMDDEHSFELRPGALYESPYSGTPLTEISIFGATTGQKFSAREW